uniref:Copia protein n=1 Tax=Cajanus cajan TaxID=3821 RepID=A0A151U6G5_CAJCA|nr:Copia protein [Cajanus cajan]
MINNVWVLDSGASHHMTSIYSQLDEVQDFSIPLRITVPTGDVVLVHKKGTIKLNENIKLYDVLFIPEFRYNLISIHKITNELNCVVTYSVDECVIQDQTRKRMIGFSRLHDGVYIFTQQVDGYSLAASSGDITALWHARMGHPSDL